MRSKQNILDQKNYGKTALRDELPQVSKSCEVQEQAIINCRFLKRH